MPVPCRQYLLTDEKHVYIAGTREPRLTLVHPTVSEEHLCLDVSGMPTLRLPLDVPTTTTTVTAK